jgi:hypothetical protein
MRNLNMIEVTTVSAVPTRCQPPVPAGSGPNKRNPAMAPGESFKGPADKNFGPK